MSEFEIDIQARDPVSGRSWDVPQGISLRSGDLCFTELIRDGGSQSDDYLRAPPVPLAFWLTDNWRRLRWEPVVSERVDLDWQLAHELSAIGGGYIWPRLRIWGEDARVGLACRSDPLSMNFALRFTQDALVFVSAEQFEVTVDRFLDRAVDATSNDREALRAQISALKDEREDDCTATWRRIEAKLGYDVGNAPDKLIELLLRYMDTYGNHGVEEAIVATQQEEAAVALEEEINAAKQSRVVCDLRDAVTAAGKVCRASDQPIWKMAENSAKAVRQGLGVQAGPLRNTLLSELLNMSPTHFGGRESGPTGWGYGLRLGSEDGKNSLVSLCSRWSQARRFELCRTLGDAVWSGNDTLGPITRKDRASEISARLCAKLALSLRRSLGLRRHGYAV